MLENLIMLAGLSQIALSLGSLLIPRLLKWKQELQVLTPFIRQIFWTYAGYIFFTNLSFGILSFFAPEALLDGSLLAKAVSGFIAFYWGARIFIQFLYFDRSAAPKGTLYVIGEWLLVLMFFFHTIVYTYAVYYNLHHL